MNARDSVNAGRCATTTVPMHQPLLFFHPEGQVFLSSLRIFPSEERFLNSGLLERRAPGCLAIPIRFHQFGCAFHDRCCLLLTTRLLAQDGKTAAQLAEEWRHPQVAEMLLNAKRQ